MKESRPYSTTTSVFHSHAVAARRLPASLPAASWPVKSPEYVWSERSTDRSGVVWHAAWARLRTPVLCWVLCCASQQGSSVVLPSRERTGFLAAGEPGRTPHTRPESVHYAMHRPALQMPCSRVQSGAKRQFAAVPGPESQPGPRKSEIP
jgi:hypothetical protein